MGTGSGGFGGRMDGFSRVLGGRNSDLIAGAKAAEAFKTALNEAVR